MTLATAPGRAADMLGRAVSAVLDPIAESVEARPLLGGLSSFAMLTAAWGLVLELPSEGAEAAGIAAILVLSVSAWASFTALLEVADSLRGSSEVWLGIMSLLLTGGFFISAGRFGEIALSSDSALLWLGLAMAFGSLFLYLLAAALMVLAMAGWRGFATRIRGVPE